MPTGTPSATPADAGPAEELAPRERALLDFERRWATRTGPKDAAIRAEFGVPTARYYQMLYVLIDTPRALRSDPLLVRRLQRLRDSRSTARAARTFRAEPLDQEPRE